MRIVEVVMDRCSRVVFPAVIILSLGILYGCQVLVPHDSASLFAPRFQRSESVRAYFRFAREDKSRARTHSKTCWKLLLVPSRWSC